MKFQLNVEQNGQSLVEYAIILTIVALSIVGLLIVYGEEIVALYQLMVDIWP